MTVFDIEPEDSFDATDPPAVQLVNIARRLLAIADSDLDSERVRYRLGLVVDDLAEIWARL